MSALLQQVIDIAQQAGDQIMLVYKRDFKQYTKTDNSPLTEADLAAHKVIVNGLRKISDLPCLSEESDPAEISWAKRINWNEYWLIDPLDGTKEFINQNDEFTVNIALIKEGKAILGVVYCPPLQRFYYAEQSVGAFKKEPGCPAIKIKVADEPKDGESWHVVGSRRHGAMALDKFSKSLGQVETLSMGSSLKLCLVAEGKAHLYPRLALTCEWDTGAAQAVVEMAGGRVLTTDLTPLMYGQKEELLNPYFIVCAQKSEKWTEIFTTLANET